MEHEAEILEGIRRGTEMKALLEAPWYNEFFRRRMEGYFEQFKRADPMDVELLKSLCSRAKVLQGFKDEIEAAAAIASEMSERLLEEKQGPEEGGKE